MLSDVQHAIEAVPPGVPLIVLADFDGTLVEFHDDPEQPMLSEVRRHWLWTIAARPDRVVGIVSGRRVADLRRRAPLPCHGYYAGLHGLEIEHGSRRWQHPDMEAARSHVVQLILRLEQVRERFPGTFIEDKSASVAVHVRRVVDTARQAALAMADACAVPWVEDGHLRRLEGQFVVEFLPAVACHKGEAVRWIAADVAQRLGRDGWVLFVGDDITDEDAFRAIDRGVGVLVGHRPTAATHRIDGIAGVDALLRWLSTRN